MEEKVTVSLCMIVKNEEKYLRQCLQSVKNIVDEMIIVDTGSTDNTVDIAKDFNSKIIYYKWKEDFAEARNVSLEYAKMDWILIMDGDDIFEVKDHDKFREVIKKIQKDVVLFNTVSFAGKTENGDIVNNLNVRLIRNNKKYKYEGAIHEQVVPIDISVQNAYEKTAVKDITIYHYGYLDEVSKAKNKSKRNISILQRELDKNPSNMFNLFNMGSEYFALADYGKAFDYYDSVYKELKNNTGYLSKLMYRRIVCLNALGRSKEALNSINNDLDRYPNFTDLVFLRGTILEKQGKYTLAINALENCIERGESPINLTFLDGSGSYKAYELLGKIYNDLKDYDRAIKYHMEAYKHRPNNKGYLANIINVLINRKNEENSELDILNEIKDFVEGNELQISDILLNRGLVEQFNKLNENNKEIDVNNNDYLFLNARKLFYQKKYIESLGYFSYLEEKQYKLTDVYKYKTLIFSIISSEVVIKYLDKINVPELDKVLLTNTFKLLQGDEIKDFESKYDSNILLDKSISILRDLLILQEFDLFGKIVNILNHIINEGILIRLAKLYDEMGFSKQASQEVVRSIKVFSITDPECINILKRSI